MTKPNPTSPSLLLAACHSLDKTKCPLLSQYLQDIWVAGGDPELKRIAYASLWETDTANHSEQYVAAVAKGWLERQRWRAIPKTLLTDYISLTIYKPRMESNILLRKRLKRQVLVMKKMCSSVGGQRLTRISLRRSQQNFKRVYEDMLRCHWKKDQGKRMVGLARKRRERTFYNNLDDYSSLAPPWLQSPAWKPCLWENHQDYSRFTVRNAPVMLQRCTLLPLNLVRCVLPQIISSCGMIFWLVSHHHDGIYCIIGIGLPIICQAG